MHYSHSKIKMPTNNSNESHTPQSTGEKIVLAVFNQLAKEIESKCDRVVKTCKKLKAEELENCLRQKINIQQLYSNSSNSNQFSHYSKPNNHHDFDGDTNSLTGEDGITHHHHHHHSHGVSVSNSLGNSGSNSSGNSILNLQPNVTIAYSDPDECLRLLQDRSDGFNQCLLALSGLSEFCLPSLISLLFQWYNEQKDDTRDVRLNSKERDEAEQFAKSYMQYSSVNSQSFFKKTDNKIYQQSDERRRTEFHLKHTQVVRRFQAIHYYLGLTFIEVLKNLKQHPPGQTLVGKLLNHCFSFFNPDRDLLTASDILVEQSLADRKSNQTRGSKHNFNNGRRQNNRLTLQIADVYAECAGVIGVQHFDDLSKKYMNLFKEREEIFTLDSNNPAELEKMVRWIRGIRFIRIARYPLSKLSEGIKFVSNIAERYLESIKKNQNKDVRQQYALTLVDILIPFSIEINVKTHSVGWGLAKLIISIT